jgi:hypothetical protein
MLNGRNAPPQRRDRMPSGAIHNRPFPCVSTVCSYFVLIVSGVKQNLQLSAIRTSMAARYLVINAR